MRSRIFLTVAVMVCMGFGLTACGTAKKRAAVPPSPSPSTSGAERRAERRDQEKRKAEVRELQVQLDLARAEAESLRKKRFEVVRITQLAQQNVEDHSPEPDEVLEGRTHSAPEHKAPVSTIRLYGQGPDVPFTPLPQRKRAVLNIDRRQPSTDRTENEDALVARYGRALRAFAERRFDRALAALLLLRSQAALHTLAPNIAFWLAETRFALGQWDLAQQAFHQALSQYPGLPWANRARQRLARLESGL